MSLCNRARRGAHVNPPGLREVLVPTERPGIQATARPADARSLWRGMACGAPPLIAQDVAAPGRAPRERPGGQRGPAR